MALPVLFAALSQATGADLDEDFAALGALTPIPCTVTGTNALTLSPLANTPTVTSYSNYMSFTAVAVASNTGAVQAQVGALPLLNVYKDSPTGPVPLTGNEIVTNNVFTLTYDSALNSGVGGFHLLTAPINAAGGTISGTLSVTGALSGGTLQVSASGNPVTRILATLSTVTFTAIAPTSMQSQSIVFAGCKINDLVALGLPAAPTNNINFDGYVSANGTIVVRAANITGASVTPGAVTLTIGVVGFT